ncbi:MAG: hypothetical protein ABSC01_02560 [Verrucomicrobiota bacterium]|jgi:hypothetical protein
MLANEFLFARVWRLIQIVNHLKSNRMAKLVVITKGLPALSHELGSNWTIFPDKNPPGLAFSFTAGKI